MKNVSYLQEKILAQTVTKKVPQCIIHISTYVAITGAELKVQQLWELLHNYADCLTICVCVCVHMYAHVHTYMDYVH